MKSIKRSLTRKLGPLPAWAWALVAFAGIYWYRQRQAAASGTGTGSVAPAPVTPQPPMDVPAGDSVYDPNTGAFDTAPGGGGGAGATNGSGTSVGNGSTGDGSLTPGPWQVGNATGVQIPSPGINSRRRPKRRDHQRGRVKVAKPVKDKDKRRARSTAAVRVSGGVSNRPKGTRAPKRGRSRAFSGGVAETTRTGRPQRAQARTAATRMVIRQRPEAATRPATRPTHVPAPRPSAPPARNPSRRRGR